MNFYAYSALFNSTLLIIAEAILIFNWKKNKPIRYFNLFNLAVLFWAISYFFWQTSKNYDQALFWVKMLMVGAILASPSLLHFSAVITNKIKTLIIPIIISYLLAFLFIFIDFTSPLYIANLQDKLGVPFFPTAGILYTIYLIQWTFWIVAAFIILFKSMRLAKGEEKGLLKALIISTLISLLAGAFNYLLWYNIPIPPITTPVTASYSIVVALFLLKSKFYKLNLFYFEFFAVIAILISLLNFFLNQNNQIPINFTAFGILVLSAYFLIQSRIRERKHLEKIESLNESLHKSIEGVINSINDSVIVVSKRLNVIEANRAALRLFDYNQVDYPKTFTDFVRGKINLALLSALRNFMEENQNLIETELLLPIHLKIQISFSLFTIEEENDAVIMIIKKM